ncbi:MAG TPA: hypothetical protein VD994_04620 [Prosthecobacter sp.]|nr:hypothetical protein [Prosthecobacter sp.]
MNNPYEPPSTPAEPAPSDQAWKTYLGAATVVLPALFFWVFATIILLPRISQVWKDAGLEGSRPQWLMDLSWAFVLHFNVIVLALAAVLLLLELRYRKWPQYRRMVIGAATFLVNTAVLLGLTVICVSALLAVPHLARIKNGEVAPPTSAPAGEVEGTKRFEAPGPKAEF